MTLVGNIPDDCLQVIVVTADSFESTEGTLSVLWRDKSDLKSWNTRTEKLHAFLGEGGVGRAIDDSKQTPVGSFPLGQTFGHSPNPDISVGNYFVAQHDDFWDTDWKHWLVEIAKGAPVDSTYNTCVHQDPGHEAERIGPNGDDDDDDPENAQYNYAILVDHNPENRPGFGCAIFLHTDADECPTWGCIAIDEEELRNTLEWLEPGANPHLSVIVEDPEWDDIPDE